jgi:hypothetical protein
MFVLFLNDMRTAHYERTQPVCRAETVEELQAFLDKEKVEPYSTDGMNQIIHTTDFVAQTAGGVVVDAPLPHRWGKTFRKDGPLEWFNPPLNCNSSEHFILAPSKEEWMRDAEENYRRSIESIPTI